MIELIQTAFLLVVFQDVVKELFSQFGSVQSVELNDHPGLPRESGPKLSKYFKPATKQVGSLSVNSVCIHSFKHCLV